MRLSKANFQGAPFPALPAVNMHRRVVRIVTRINHPVLLDGRDLQVQFDVAHEVLVGIVEGKDFPYKERVEILPAQGGEINCIGRFR